VKTFEISIPPLRQGGISINLTVEAQNWMDAFQQLASNELREELGLDQEMTDLPADSAISIKDVASGRVYQVTALPEPEEESVTMRDAKPAGLVVDPSLLAEGAADAGDGSDDDSPTLPGTRKGRRRRTVETLIETPAAGGLRRAVATAMVEAPPEIDEDGAMTILGGSNLIAGKALVQNPGLHKVEKPTRLRAMDTIQHAPAAPDVNATIMDGTAIAEAMKAKPMLPPIVNAPGLKKVRTIIRPAQGKQEDDGHYFRPVSMLGTEASSLMELIDGAMNMAYDHVPCEAVQCLMYMEDRQDLFVAAARGTFARQVVNAYVGLPTELGIERLGEPTPMNFAQEQFDLCYIKDGETYEMEVVTALWIPVVVEEEIIAVVLVANSKHHNGFSAGELRGAEYLTDTLSKEIENFLATSEG